MEMIMKETIIFMWNSIINQFHIPVTITSYIFFTVVIFFGMVIFVEFYESGLSIGGTGLIMNIFWIILIWLRTFNMVYKVLITLPNIALPIILYVKSVIDEKSYHKESNEAIEKFNNGDSSEVFRMGISPQQLSIPEGCILVCRRGYELSKIDKIPEHEWFEYTICNGLEKSDIKPYLSFRSGQAKGIKRYYLIKENEFDRLQQFIDEKRLN